MPHWWLTRDGDERCLELFRRHYSHREYADGRMPKLFVGPGEKVVLRTANADAVFVWRRFIDDSGQSGVNCAVFRNESAVRSSELIREACDIAWAVWPDCRCYTYVDPWKVRSTNPGFCFLAAGWRRCKDVTKSGKIVLEIVGKISGEVKSSTNEPSKAEELDRINAAWGLTKGTMPNAETDTTLG